MIVLGRRLLCSPSWRKWLLALWLSVYETSLAIDLETSWAGFFASWDLLPLGVNCKLPHCSAFMVHLASRVSVCLFCICASLSTVISFSGNPLYCHTKEITGIFSCSVTAASVAMDFLAFFPYGEWGGGRIPVSRVRIRSRLFYSTLLWTNQNMVSYKFL